jgi:hypothetical protein
VRAPNDIAAGDRVLLTLAGGRLTTRAEAPTGSEEKTE